MITKKISARLATSTVAWFSTVLPGGSPHTVPVWFTHDDEFLWVASPASSRKVANVRHNDHVSLAIDGSAPEPLVALTRADIVDSAHDFPAVVSAFAEKYGGFDITVPSVSGPLVLMRLDITRWLLDGSPQ